MEFGKNHPLEPFYKKKSLEMAVIFFSRWWLYGIRVLKN